MDLDGTLSEIVASPELARPAQGVREVLGGLAKRYRLVAIITGRRAEEASAILGVDHVVVLGLYGFEDAAPDLVTSIAPLVEAAVAAVPQAWVEDKAASIAVHYRQAPDPDAARASLTLALRSVADEAGLHLVEGKMVLELVPPGRPMKGAAVERLAGERALEAILYAGDDHADIDAFHALDRLRERGAVTVRVAVRDHATPSDLLGAADLVVDGPDGLVELLRSLLA